MMARLVILILAMIFAPVSFAQSVPEVQPEIPAPVPDSPQKSQPESPPDIGDDENAPAQSPPDVKSLNPLQFFENWQQMIDDKNKIKDLTIRSEAGRKKILNQLFAKLRRENDADTAKLIAEEIWAVFLQSRSASIDFTLSRGIKAHNEGDRDLARRMYNHVTRLSPEYAEGWSRSARLAYDEKDMSKALAFTTQTLILEPRHFFALWTLGNIFETMGKQNQALEVYKEAGALYPAHTEIKARIEYLESKTGGEVF